jgi:ribosome-binding factor A
VADNARAKRLADLIREVVAEKLHRGIKDPRLGTHVTVTDTRVTGDLREATVFYTVYGDEEDRKSAAAGLESAKGTLRTAVGAAAGVKHTPSLTFVADALPDNARTIDDLLARAKASDEEVRKSSSGAHYAGGADPYRKPAEEDEVGAEADGSGDEDGDA